MARVRLQEKVVYRSFGSETVLLNLTTGQYHGLKGSGGRMLEVLAETPDLDDAAAQIASEYGQPVERIRQDLGELCDQLAARSLITIDDGPAPAE
jgi:hypothetical protein